jgi:hypothetical protein
MERDQMNEMSCAKELAVAAALRSGTLGEELLAHVSACPACSDVLLVASSLQNDGASLEAELGVPDAAVAWRKAETRAKEQAIAKATLPIRIVRVCTYVFAFVAAFRLIVELFNHPTWLTDLGISPLHVADNNSLAVLSGTTALGIAISVVFLGASSWYMLRQE